MTNEEFKKIKDLNDIIIYNQLRIDRYEVLKLDNVDKLDNIKLPNDNNIYNLKGCATIRNSNTEVGAWSEFMEPIKLTYELLTQIGFIGNKYQLYMKLDDYVVTLLDTEASDYFDGYYVVIRNMYDELILKTDYTVLYLHKLQNLIYVVTNMHLNVNNIKSKYGK